MDWSGIAQDHLPLRMKNGGLFISRGLGGHPERVIDSWELIVVVRGTLLMFEDDCELRAEAGEALVLRPGRRHGGRGVYPPDLTFFWVHFMVADSALESSLPTWSRVARPDRMEVWWRNLLAFQEEGTPESGDLLLLLMLRELGDPAALPSDGGHLAADAMKYIKLHFAEPVSTADIAEALQCNPDYLGRVFRLTYGSSPVEQLNLERLRYARRLLLDSVLNVNQIAAACGFGDPAWFRRRFRHETGMTPLRYRRTYGKVHVNTT